MTWRTTFGISALAASVTTALFASACGGGSPPRAPDEVASTPDAASAEAPEASALPVEMPPSATAAAGHGEAPKDSDSGPPSTTPAPPPTSRSMEECATLGRFPDASVAADAGAGGPKTVVPWMVDPFGDQAPKTTQKKGEKPAKKPPVDKHVDALRAEFRRCYSAAKKTDPTQSVALSFEHKPKGGQHVVCVMVKREEGKEDVTRVMTECMMQAIKDWAAKAP